MPCFLPSPLSSSSPLSAFAEEFRIAVLDFSVESDNPQFKFLGRGFAEMTSVEPAKVPGVVLADRTRRNEALDEPAFSMSDAATRTRLWS